MNQANGFIGKTDFYIAAFIMLLAALFSVPHLWRSEPVAGRIVIADRQGELYILNLEELRIKGAFTRDFIAKTGPITFQFDPDKGVRVTKASCPDKICIHTGFVHDTGKPVVCLPGEIYAVVQERTGKVDATLY